MNFKDFLKIILLFIFMGITVYIIILTYNGLTTKSSLYNTDQIFINPSTNKGKNDCLSKRTPCNPNDPNSCSNLCNNVEELQCVNLDSLNPVGGKSINEGGYVCLPSPVNEKCNKATGGVLAWTGWGSIGTADWSCLCLYPDMFNGPDCSQQTTGYCTGGTLDTSKLDGSQVLTPKLLQSICSCPSGTTKVYNDASQLPFCASSTKNSMGVSLLGNVWSSPDWKNIYYCKITNPQNGQSNTDVNLWADNIIKELYFSNYSQLTNDDILNLTRALVINPSGPAILNTQTPFLTSTIANQICSTAIKTISTVTPDSKMCSSTGANNFPSPSEIPQVIYTYYDNTELPEGSN